MKQIDKLVVTNQAALTSKYGAAEFAVIKAALDALIAADKTRGLVTRTLFIDNAAEMKAVGGSPVGGPADERGTKAAVDAAFTVLTPDYILLLDGPDVVPHVQLNAVAGLNDGDVSIPSDLPYASAGAWSRNASQFLAVTRVIGRLPAAEGTKESAPIVAALEASCAQVPQPASAYAPPFAISAAVWQASTQTSINAVFGPGTALDLAPVATHPAIDQALPRLAHFINCHGDRGVDEFYGQQGAQYPVAMKSAKVAPRVARGAVVAAECCYGAELYDFNTLGVAPPICMAYVRGAPPRLSEAPTIRRSSAGNAQADLLNQYFLIHMLAGASTGRAMLQARQDFIRTQLMSNPANLKTVAQFLLLGDPSCQPCQPADFGPEQAGTKGIGTATSADDDDAGLARKARRVALGGAGRAVASTATRTGQRTSLPRPILEHVERLARERAVAIDALTVLEVTGGATYRAASKALSQEERKVAVIVDRNATTDERRKPFIRLLVAHIVGDRIVRVEETERR